MGTALDDLARASGVTQGMTLPFTRVAAIWCGVGLGHLAALGWMLGSPGAPRVAGDGIVIVELLAAERPATPVARLAAQPAPAPAAEPLLPEVIASPSPPVPPAVEAAPARVVAVAEGRSAPQPPQFLERVEPAYPRAARLAGVEGVVSLRLSLDAAGRLVSAEVAASSGSPALDQAALAAARASRYQPARLGAVAVPAETSAAYRFELR